MTEQQRKDLLQKVEKYYKMGNIDLDTFLQLVEIIKGTEKKRGLVEEFMDEYHWFKTQGCKKRASVVLDGKVYRLVEDSGDDGGEIKILSQIRTRVGLLEPDALGSMRDSLLPMEVKHVRCMYGHNDSFFGFGSHWEFRKPLTTWGDLVDAVSQKVRHEQRIGDTSFTYEKLERLCFVWIKIYSDGQAVMDIDWREVADKVGPKESIWVSVSE